MYTFLLRLLLFICLWVLMIYDTNDQLIFSLFMLTISLVIFFFLSNARATVYLYGILIVVLFLHGIIIRESVYTSFLLLLVVIIASFRLTKKLETYVLVSIAFVLAILLAVFQNEHII